MQHSGCDAVMLQARYIVDLGLTSDTEQVDHVQSMHADECKSFWLWSLLLVNRQLPVVSIRYTDGPM